VKASRPGSDAHPGASSDEQTLLQQRAEGLARARKMPAVALLALIKGHKVRFKRLALFLPQRES
jgi:hypothetical protein